MTLASAQSDKGALRAQYQSIRCAISPTDKVHLDKTIQGSVLTVLPTLNLQRPFIALYRSVRGEVDVFPLAPTLMALGWHIAVPVVHKSDPLLRLVEVDEQTAWRPGAFGINEPALAPSEHASIPADACSAVVVPGLAFTPDGQRLGFGGGYYDRWLVGARLSVLRIGVAYAGQIATTLPTDRWDQPVTVVVTDKVIYHCHRQSNGRSENGDEGAGR